MDFMSINDLLLEGISAFVLITLLFILYLRGNFTSLAQHPGWKSILVGFSLITIATLLDITDEIPGLERFVIIGNTVYEAFLEKLPGYLLGYIMVLVGFQKMIPSLQKAQQNEQALHESEERFRQIFEANPDPVILIRIDSGTIVDANPTFEAYTGFNRDEALGKSTTELSLWTCSKQRKTFFAQLEKNELVDSFETELMMKSGTVHPTILSAKIVTIAEDVCALIVIRDISKTKEAEQSLAETDRLRKEFISTAAHELRTPLCVIIGYSELLAEPGVFEQFSARERSEFLEEIKGKGQVLSQIVDDLLDVSRIDANLIFELNLETVDPVNLLEKTLADTRVLQTNHTITLKLPEERGQQLECDSQRVTQVLENLINNAVKYTPQGGSITLAGTDHPGYYEFSVTDEGIGMTPEQVERVFEKFYRVDSSDTAVSGLGLGMSIVKQIVEAHDGSIDISSIPGKGTGVKINLPKTEPDKVRCRPDDSKHRPPKETVL